MEVIGSWTSGLTHSEEAGSSRALLFFAFTEDNNADMNVTSVTYGGQSMTEVIERNQCEESSRKEKVDRDHHY